MEFNLHQSVQILERTPVVITAMLEGLPEEWVTQNEGPGTWSPYDIVGHLVHGENTDWIPRMKIILADTADKAFTPFDRFAQFENSKGKSLSQLLNTFRLLRQQNIQYLHSCHLTAEDFTKQGIHPAFGPVTLAQLLATWTVHDLNHIAQIARVMARQYQPAVGPWVAYLGILQNCT
jgi:uncharacterized damage-inducible protein DinB